MKMRRDHLVPLSPQVVRILRDIKETSGKSAFLFPAPTRSKVPHHRDFSWREDAVAPPTSLLTKTARR